jgi:phage head maturation protease
MENALKAVSQSGGELRVGNYIVLFGGKDLTGEFFTQKTKFDSTYTDIGLLYVDFEHGRDHEGVGNSKNNVLGVVDWKSARIDDKGIFVERILNRRSDYVKYLEELIAAGIIGTSSEAVPTCVRKKSSGEIVEWPLMRDALTVTPMEPRMVAGNVLTAAKALAAAFPASKSLAQIAGASHSEQDIRRLSDVLQRARGQWF